MHACKNFLRHSVIAAEKKIAQDRHNLLNLSTINICKTKVKMVLQGSLFIMKGPKIDEKARYQMLNALVKVVSLKKQQLLTMHDIRYW